MAAEFHSHLPGFASINLEEERWRIQLAVLKRGLTQNLGVLTSSLSSEASFATELIFGSNNEWQETAANEAVLDLVARLSCHAFVGPELCRNEAWVRITKDYATITFASAGKLNIFPYAMRPLVNWLDPGCRRVRALVSEARDILVPAFEKRRLTKQVIKASDLEPPVFNDTIEWAEEASQGRYYDPVEFQLGMTLVALHTTTNLLGVTLMLLAENPQSIEPLREEMSSILRDEGWSKTALYNMKLLDSAIKEAQRMCPPDILNLRRFATANITLPDGTLIRKGERTVVVCDQMMDPDVYPDPETFDIYRFKRMRDEAGADSKAQLVSVSPEHVGFGYGAAACPGRFLAANEVKIALCHLLLKYDWKVAKRPYKRLVIGTSSFVGPEAMISFRRRKEEVDLEAL
ncbi:Cytochrome P450 monooygenase 1 [Colletotrichum sidae]|uniref:Cytochrome P450 monooygenase 1 n=1 Tax=Colletotrichum sidae TaxID=1347389 RepID=A0A4R8TQG7_9PEZI|nr:Cytochrome P450 monooygenase 1 [Colletotrichum sidae]